MAERFDTWPHDATGIVKEALREYVGDGDGEDEKVLAAHNAIVAAKALWDAAAWEGSGIARVLTDLADEVERQERAVEALVRIRNQQAERAEKAEAERDRWKTAYEMAEPVLTERDRLRAAVDEVKALADGGLEVAMLGTTDGDLIDPDSEIPAGEMYRLAHVAIRAALDEHLGEG